MIRIKNLRLNYDKDDDLLAEAAARLNLPPQALLGVFVVRKALDARRYKGQSIVYVYEVDVELAEGIKEKTLLGKFRRDKNISAAPKPIKKFIPRLTEFTEEPPVVVGFGPAGIFAALTLAKAGLRPIILERGMDVDTRRQDVERFWQGGTLSPNSNVQFGEGGAGTFSDGKLTARQHDPLMKDILETFINAGAPAEIAYLHKPHIGTDILCSVVKKIRQEIIALGGTIRFGVQVTDIIVSETGGEISGLILNDSEELQCHNVFFAIGHSARDTYEMLHRCGVMMEAKSFAMGVRIEHQQSFINAMQYGEHAVDIRLPAADYALTYKDISAGRGVYSFCMCPGGYVVAAASEPERVVTNGMSNHARNSGTANSALLVQVSPRDYGTADILAGMRLQREIESAAYVLGGGDYLAPVQTVGDFLSKRAGTTDFAVTPTYRPGVRAVNLRSIIPNYIADSLDRGLRYFNERVPGFAAADIPLTGVESRSSAPCRILRSPLTLMSENTKGLYPIGEGAGYAGGIMSAALDGMKAGLVFLQKIDHTN